MHPPTLIVLQPTSFCNISCDYCYLGNKHLKNVMQPDVLHSVATRILSDVPRDSQPTIVWHAGEPTTLPISWYDDAYAILKAAAPEGARWAMQTNGVAINSKWIDFFQRTATNVNLSIDGPARFHNARRRTRTGGPTSHLAMRALHRLQAAGLYPGVISVISAGALESADEHYEFYRDNSITNISISIDEIEAVNTESSFGADGNKAGMAAFLLTLLTRAFEDKYPLSIREVERIANIVGGRNELHNEQIVPWEILIVTWNGDFSTFSPEGVEVRDARYDNFIFGNILRLGVEQAGHSPFFQKAHQEIVDGVEECRRSCRYFGICGGGAPSTNCLKRDL